MSLLSFFGESEINSKMPLIQNFTSVTPTRIHQSSLPSPASYDEMSWLEMLELRSVVAGGRTSTRAYDGGWWRLLKAEPAHLITSTKLF